ncbi:hypothetical protein CHS0354_013131 [Potamilus streckersoni]|uniref:Cytochrome c domain-containing protein n=1 Tax=Potamilus streckersoni TaxID=2493646 RepID=A0AAE0S6G7_9BIVA|nr:hypothetical protein CHS0354_013131 [Potamilus streckersoni]
MKKLLYLFLILAGVFVAGCTGNKSASMGDSMVKADGEKVDTAFMSAMKTSFDPNDPQEWKDRLKQDEVQALCSKYKNQLPEGIALKVIEDSKKSVVYPASGKLMGDWKKGEALANNGRGGHIGKIQPDKADVKTGGNCYACHALDPKEVAAGSMGISLTGYGKIRTGLAAASYGYSRNRLFAATPSGKTGNLYEIPGFGDFSVFHITDTHAQLLPVYFREPNVNLGLDSARNRPPHLTGDHLLKFYNIKPNSPEAYAFTHLNFPDVAKMYGKTGGYAHLATLLKQLKADRKHNILLDGGDTWQGSATALWTKAEDMVTVSKLLGVDAMTGHFEFTYGQERVQELVKMMEGKTEFIAQNILTAEFEDAVFKPYIIRELNGTPVAVIGQAFPYTSVSNPSWMFPDWSFGIRQQRLQKIVDEVRQKAQVVILLSHNGTDVDFQLASEIRGIDVILGGHTHDALPKAIEVKNSGGRTVITNGGSHGKYLGVIDIKVSGGKFSDYRYHMLPVFANLLPADKEMEALIQRIRAPYAEKLSRVLAKNKQLLFRRGNFGGTADQLILEALLKQKDAQISFSPGFRWGISLLPGEDLTGDYLMNMTAITYPQTTLSNLSGLQIKEILEDVADNIFNKNPYYQQGGDMVRVGGMTYKLEPGEDIGKRISGMMLNGKAIEADKTYKVAGWSPVAKQTSDNEKDYIWNVVERHILDLKTIDGFSPNYPELIGVKDNMGISDM